MSREKTAHIYGIFAVTGTGTVLDLRLFFAASPAFRAISIRLFLLNFFALAIPPKRAKSDTLIKFGIYAPTYKQA